MIITCPSCGSRYLVDGHAVGEEGRKVRCANCKHAWVQKPASDLPRTLSPPALPPPPADFVRVAPPGAGAEAARAGGGLVAGWTALALLVVGVVGGAVLAREPISAAWPVTAQLYQAVGLPVEPPGTGLEVRVTSRTRAVDDGVAVLIIEGEVVNVSGEPKRVPALRAALLDSGERELQQWSFAARSPRLLPGESAAFRTSVRKPSPEATSLAIIFAPAE